MKYFVSAIFCFYSSICLAIQTRQQCVNTVHDSSLHYKICHNHVDHYAHTLSPATGIIIDKLHHLYADKAQKDYSVSELGRLAQNLKATLGANAETLSNIDDFHDTLAQASGRSWGELDKLLQHTLYTVPTIRPLKLLMTVSFADSSVHEGLMKFDSQTGFQPSPIDFSGQAASVFDCSHSSKNPALAALHASLSNRELGASVSSVGFDSDKESYTLEIECVFHDGKRKKVILVCPHVSEQKQKNECSAIRNQLPGLGIKFSVQDPVAGKPY